MDVLALLWRFRKALALIALILALVGAGYAWKARVEAQKREVAALKAERDAARAEVAALQEAKRLQDAANEAASAARERNDSKIPEVRRDTQGRVDRAPTADAAVSLQDDTEALAAYDDASRSVRGESAP